MKFSEQWVREWVNPAISTAELCEQITMLGLEVDGVEKVAGDFTGVVVGEVVGAGGQAFDVEGGLGFVVGEHFFKLGIALLFALVAVVKHF